ncbi:sensor histidine kinase [Capnocytophaga gingivalis]
MRCKQRIGYYLLLWAIAFLLITLTDILGYGAVEEAQTRYSLNDFMYDALLLAVFLSVSLLFNQLFMRWFKPLQHYPTQLVLYSVLLLLTNIGIALTMTKVQIWLWGELSFQEYIKIVYLFALVATFISSIDAHITFQAHYQSQRETTLIATFQALQAQLDPHFLFNNFSILSELIEENKHEAQEFLDHLTKVYRYKLVNMNKPLISLQNELTMLRSYLALLQMRFGKGIQVTLPTDAAIAKVQGLGIPPLAIQLLVENAVKHNAHSTAYPLQISVNIEEQTVIVRNVLQPLRSAVASIGVGIFNLRKRYELLPAKKIEILNNGEVFEVKIPLLKM